uniref:Bromo domain-containing protein n=1 Tax=Anolis carolinensis TaxID=28377 RepID=A0A803T830_ANOCA
MGHVWTWLEPKGEVFTESEKSSSCQSSCSSPDSSLDLELKWGNWREMEETDEEDLEESSSQEENGRSEIGDLAACEKVSTKNQEGAETCKNEIVLQFISEEEVAVENTEEEAEDWKDSDFHMSYGNDDPSPCGTPWMSSPSTSTASLPSTQPSQEDLLQQRLVFRRTLLSILKMVTGHRFSGPFLKAVSEKQAPGYNEVVKRPMDLSSIKKSLSKGQIQSMIQLQRDLMLMFQNAIMYNSSNHHIHRIAVEMQREVLEQLQMLGEVLLCSEEMQGFLRGVEDPDD